MIDKNIDNKWHTGPPPSTGWWPASCSESKGFYRWWDGKSWSDYAKKTYTAELAAIHAQRKLRYPNEIKWQKRPASWPESSLT